MIANNLTPLPKNQAVGGAGGAGGKGGGAGLDEPGGGGGNGGNAGGSAGGAIYVAQGALTLTGGSIDHNQAVGRRPACAGGEGRGWRLGIWQFGWIDLKRVRDRISDRVVDGVPPTRPGPARRRIRRGRQ